MKLIIEPDAGVGPLLAAIRSARKSVEIAIFRFDRRDIEMVLKAAAAAKGVGVTAVIAFANRGGEQSLRRLELRFLDAGIIVARSANDLIRYHGKYILIDRRVLYVRPAQGIDFEFAVAAQRGRIAQHEALIKRRRAIDRTRQITDRDAGPAVTDRHRGWWRRGRLRLVQRESWNLRCITPPVPNA